MEVEALSSSPPPFHFNVENNHDSSSLHTDLRFNSDQSCNPVSALKPSLTVEINESDSAFEMASPAPVEKASGGSELARGTSLDDVDSESRSVATSAVKLQKVYRSYRTRRRLADTAVVAEELWWQAIDYARQNHSTISFFNFCKHETAASRWCRVSLNASKVGKGLSQDAKAQQLAFQHWIEAIDPRHRYGHNLHMYYEEWCRAKSGQPFFYWLDAGDGKFFDHKGCPRSKLREQCIKYLGPQERKYYEYFIIDGKITHKMTGDALNTSGEGKWIFVMSTCKKLYAGVKKKGRFHHSSFLAGGATLAAGNLIVEDGTLKSISAYSGHYRPSDDRLDTFLTILKENGVNLEEVEIHRNEEYSDCYEEKASNNVIARSPADLEESLSDTSGPTADEENESTEHPNTDQTESENGITYQRSLSGGLQSPKAEVPKKAILERISSKSAVRSYQLGMQLSRKWSTGAGPRIGCVADYPHELRFQALEFTELSPRKPLPPSLSSSPRVPGFLSPTGNPSPA